MAPTMTAIWKQVALIEDELERLRRADDEYESLCVSHQRLEAALRKIVDVAENAGDGEGLGVQRNAMLAAARAALSN